MHRAALLLCGLAACSGRRADRQAVAAPPSDVAAPPAVAAPAGVATATAAPAVAREVRAACDGVARFWRGDSTSVRVVDSVVTPWTNPAEVSACLVLVEQEHGMLRQAGAIADTVTQQLGPALALTRSSGAGWVPLYHYSADGPDGTDMGYQRGTVRCLVEQSWDGGDDSDSTYVPTDWFKERTTCWSVPGGIAVADTASPG